MGEQGLAMVGVKVVLKDGSEIEPSCWAVAFLQEGEADAPLAKWEWSRGAHSSTEIIVLGTAIEGLLDGYNELNKEVVLLLPPWPKKEK